MAQKEHKQSSFLMVLLKIILGIIIVVVALVVGLYLYLRFALGFDVIDIRNKIRLLNRDVTESQIVTNPYNDEDAENGFSIIFGSNNIYFNNGEGYSFDIDAFDEGNLSNLEVCLTDKQFASVVNVCIKNAIQEEISIEDVSLLLDLKQIIFSNLQTEEDGSISVEVNTVLKLDFTSFKDALSKEDNFITNIILNVIPNSIYISSNNKVIVSEDNSYEITPINTIINGLTKEQSQGILDLVEKLFEQSKNENLVSKVATGFLDSLLIGSDNNGLLRSINGVESFTFKEVNDKVCIVLVPSLID